MTTRRGIYRLEAAAASQANEESLLPHLFNVLAQADVLLWPVRFQNAQSFTAQVLAAKAYHSEGMAYTVGSGDAQSWKTSQRIREALERRGWVELLSDGKLKPTLQGDTLARLCCGLPTIRSEIAAMFLERLGELKEDRVGGWICESTLLGDGEDWNDSGQWQFFTELMMPLISFRVVEARSSTLARIFYRATGEKLPAAPQVQALADGSEIYTHAYCQAMKQKRQLAKVDSAEIIIPLSGTR